MRSEFDFRFKYIVKICLNILDLTLGFYIGYQDRIVNTKLSTQNYQHKIINTENMFFLF